MSYTQYCENLYKTLSDLRIFIYKYEYLNNISQEDLDSIKSFLLEYQNELYGLITYNLNDIKQVNAEEFIKNLELDDTMKLFIHFYNYRFDCGHRGRHSDVL